MSEEIRRGFVPSDAKDFAEAELPRLRRAQDDIREWLDRGYPMGSASRFVGDHYQLTERQRLMVTRASSSSADLASRAARRVRDPLKGQTVHIDGLNLIITLETALCGTTLFRCMDGTVRDLSAVRGTYRLIAATRTAADWLGDYLEALEIGKAVVYLDAPVSNTGRLKALLAERFAHRAFACEIRVTPHVDRILWEQENVLSGDAIILNHCRSWLNTAADILSLRAPDVKIYRMCGQDGRDNRVYVAVKGVVRNEPGRVLLVQRRDQWERFGIVRWEFPGGTLEFGEKPQATLVREMREETGLSVVPERILYLDAVQPEPRYEVVIATYLCRCKDTSAVRLSEEHLAYQWADRQAMRACLAADIQQCLETNGLWDLFI